MPPRRATRKTDPPENAPGAGEVIKSSRGRRVRGQTKNEKTRTIEAVMADLTRTREQYLPQEVHLEIQYFESAKYFVRKVLLAKSLKEIRACDRWYLQEMICQAMANKMKQDADRKEAEHARPEKGPN